MRVNIKLYYELLSATEELYDQFLQKVLSHSANYPDFSTPGLNDMSKSGLLKFSIYKDPNKSMTLEEYVRVTMADPKTINFFITNKVTKAQYAFISVKKLSNTSVEWIRILAIDHNIKKIYGSTLQECLQKILSGFTTGKFCIHTKDRACDDIRHVISSLNGITVDICGEVHFSFDRQNPIHGVAAYKPCTTNDIKVITVDESEIGCFEEALKNF